MAPVKSHEIKMMIFIIYFLTILSFGSFYLIIMTDKKFYNFWASIIILIAPIYVILCIKYLKNRASRGKTRGLQVTEIPEIMQSWAQFGVRTFTVRGETFAIAHISGQINDIQTKTNIYIKTTTSGGGTSHYQDTIVFHSSSTTTEVNTTRLQHIFFTSQDGRKRHGVISDEYPVSIGDNISFFKLIGGQGNNAVILYQNNDRNHGDFLSANHLIPPASWVFSRAIFASLPIFLILIYLYDKPDFVALAAPIISMVIISMGVFVFSARRAENIRREALKAAI